MLTPFIKKRNDDDRFANFYLVGGTNMSSLTQFFRNVGTEMRKVSWPKRKELTGYTITVISTVAILAVFFALIDLVISKSVRAILGL